MPEGLSKAVPSIRYDWQWSESLFVWGVWAALSISAVSLVLSYGHNVPHFDEWQMVPYVTGTKAVTLQWLWEQHNEHRIPAGKLIQLGLAYLTNCDFRAGMFLNVASLSIISALLLAVVRRLRGRYRFYDAVLPILCLHGGHAENFLWSFQVSFIVSLLPLCLLLTVIVLQPQGPKGIGALFAATSLLSLPFFGAQGLPYVPCLAFWYGAAALSRWKEAVCWKGRLAAGVMMGVVLLAAAMVALYFVDLHSCSHHPKPTSVRQFASGFLRFLSTGLAPESTLLGLAWRLLAPAFAAAAVAVLAINFVKRRTLATLGLAMFLCGTFGLAAGISYGRAVIGCSCSRYCVLALPALLAAYFAFLVHSNWRLSEYLQPLLFFVAFYCLAINQFYGTSFGDGRSKLMTAFQLDLSRGLPAPALAQRHRWMAPFEDYHCEQIVTLGRSNHPTFAGLANLPLEYEMLSEKVDDIEDKGPILSTGSPHSCMLSKPSYSYGIRLCLRVLGAGTLKVSWKNGEGSKSRSYGRLLQPSDKPVRVTVWTYGELDRVRLEVLGSSCRMQLSDVTILKPMQPISKTKLQ